jgi:succinyl-diaminopimelate desuccinylase
VIELGLMGGTMHKTDECVALSEIENLTNIYAALLTDYFNKPPV